MLKIKVAKMLKRNWSMYIAYIAVSLSILLILGALSAMPAILGERRLAKSAKTLAQNREITKLPDEEIRSRLQQLARKNGFHLAFENIIVKYSEIRSSVDLAQPQKLGYTLPVDIPVFVLWSFPIVAVREFNISPAVIIGETDG